MTNEEFSNQIKQLAKRISETQSSIKTEEATKMSFIVPLFQILGYDVFNPKEFVPEFIADVGTKKHEKVDYAIIINDTPTILIEAKWCGETLECHRGQLIRYFTTTDAKFAILTNGINYKFYTDLDNINKMDERPFLDINLLDLKDSQISELRKFCKDRFDLSTIVNSATELKYTSLIKQQIHLEMNNPSDAFVKVLIANVYDGLKTQKVIDNFKGLVKKSFNQYLNEAINDRLKNALESEKADEEKNVAVINDIPEDEASKIVTTEEELQAFYIIKSILSGTVPLHKISHKDTESYFGILYDNNTRKWICRLKLGERVNKLYLPSINNSVETISY